MLSFAMKMIANQSLGPSGSPPWQICQSIIETMTATIPDAPFTSNGNSDGNNFRRRHLSIWDPCPAPVRP